MNLPSGPTLVTEMRNSLSGTMVMVDPFLLSKWMGSRISQTLAGLSCSVRPTLWMRATYGADDPSPMGGSLASISMSALSIPSPVRAERMCSTVWTLTEPSARVVARSTVWTLLTSASMNGWSGRSTLRNLNPWLVGAGLMVSVTFWPV